MVTPRDPGQQARPHCPFPRTARLKTSRGFAAVFQGRRRVADEVLVVHWLMTGLPATAQLGLSIGRKAGNAVLRNRWKRLVREAFRHVRPLLPPGLVIVVRPQDGAETDHARVAASLERLTRRLLARGQK